MATTILMPQMGYDMTEGTVVRWRKQEGEAVTRGEVIAEIETDKATVEMEAYSTGVLGKIVVEEGRMVPVGELIAVITEPGEAIPALEDLIDQPSATEPAQAPSELPAPQGAPQEAPAEAAPSGQVKATPIARRLGREKDIDLTQITGTGPAGRITEADVLAYEGTTKPAPAAPGVTTGERVELSKMRRAIASVTAQSKRESPHFYVTSEIDMTEAMAVRRQLNDSLQASPDPERSDGARHGTRVSVNDMVVKAAAKALEKFPKFNASFHQEYLQLNPDLNIGIAIALEQGLIVPSIGSCQNKSLVEIAGASSDLIERAQSGALRAEEYTGGTFSISNLGMFDVDNFTAIIFPPNAAVLAVGTVKEQPVVRSGQVAIAQIMKATLSVDHRVADGAEGAWFLMEVKRSLESPVSLLL